MSPLDALLRALLASGGSDLHLAPGRVPQVRSDGALHPIEGAAATPAGDLARLLREAVGPDAWARFEREGDVDVTLALPGGERFRAHVLARLDGPAGVIRVVPARIPGFSDLGLPEAVGRLADLSGGLVLATGSTGSGKSTTLAALVDRINSTHARYVVTIEDPVEFVHRSRRSIVSHRSIGLHAPSFAEALRGALRQSPDVILVGELRDLETVTLALDAAEAGVLVLGSLHARDATRALARIIDVHPGAQQQGLARALLARTLQAVVAQQLVPRADGRGRCAAVEVLLRTPALSGAIREPRPGAIRALIEGGRAQGMQSMDDALLALAETRRVLPRDAWRRARDKGRFRHLVSGG